MPAQPRRLNATYFSWPTRRRRVYGSRDRRDPADQFIDFVNLVCAKIASVMQVLQVQVRQQFRQSRLLVAELDL